MNRYKKIALRDAFFIISGLLITFGLVKGASFYLHAVTPNIQTAQAAQPVLQNPNVILVESTPQITDKPYQDTRAERLQKMLQEKNSPLAPYAQDMVDLADHYDIGWTRVYAIAGVESGFGTKVAKDSYNAWGVMQNGKIVHFSSWEEGIEYVSRLLGTYYQENANKGISTKYCPPSECNGDWAKIVTQFSNEVLQ